jgi:UPF0755 protein
MRRLLASLFLVAMALVASAALVLRREWNATVTLPAKVEFEVAPGERTRAIADRLESEGIVRRAEVFLLAARLHGGDRRIRHGRHEFEGTLTLAAVLEELARTPKPILRVTIPEGLTVRDIAALLERSGAGDASAYLAVACSEEFRRLVQAPVAASCAEGFLFPDTYDLLPGLSPGTIVDLQHRRFLEVVGRLLGPPPTAEEPAMAGAEEAVDVVAAQEQDPSADPGRASSAGAAPPGKRPVDLLGAEDDPERPARILTLASIIEKETGVPSERRRIAGVFYNRLRLGMRLQTDPTVIYGVIDSGEPWDGNLTRAHLRTPTPYNTYTNAGLPPAPICNPGRAAVEAALDPEETPFLYFVSRGDGSHEFSRNLDEHNRAVRRYQLGR